MKPKPYSFRQWRKLYLHWKPIILGGFTVVVALWAVVGRVKQLPPVSSRVPTAKVVPGRWQQWDGCRLVEDRTNDGDSFRISYAGAQHVLRLYFVDCAEKEVRRDNSERLMDQARYFGHTDVHVMAARGQEAKAATLDLLASQPFTVVTKGESVYDSQRIYGHVFIGGKSANMLAERLVGLGLARIHTKGEAIPGIASGVDFKKRLQQVEATVKAQQQGAWKR